MLTTTASGDTDGDKRVEKIYSYGARSFSIWNAQGRLVWDSGPTTLYQVATQD